MNDADTCPACLEMLICGFVWLVPIMTIAFPYRHFAVLGTIRGETIGSLELRDGVIVWWEK